MKKIVVACLGDPQSADRIAALSREAEVIAVAMDLGASVSLGAARESALAAGASRCHALDVREEYVRECLLPALHARVITGTPVDVADHLPSFLTRRLAEIARLEGAEVDETPLPAVRSRRLPTTVFPPVQLDIAFEDGVPVSINGVTMTLTELVESVETITGEPALDVLERELARSRDAQPA